MKYRSVIILVIGAVLLFLGAGILFFFPPVEKESGGGESPPPQEEESSLPPFDYSSLPVTEEEANHFFQGDYSSEETCTFFQKIISEKKESGYTYRCPQNDSVEDPSYLILEEAEGKILRVFSIHKERLLLTILEVDS